MRGSWGRGKKNLTLSSMVSITSGSVTTSVPRRIKRSFSSMTCPAIDPRTTKTTRVGSIDFLGLNWAWVTEGDETAEDAVEVLDEAADPCSAIVLEGNDSAGVSDPDPSDPPCCACCVSGIFTSSPACSDLPSSSVCSFSAHRSLASILRITVSWWQGGGGHFFSLAGMWVGCGRAFTILSSKRRLRTWYRSRCASNGCVGAIPMMQSLE